MVLDLKFLSPFIPGAAAFSASLSIIPSMSSELSPLACAGLLGWPTKCMTPVVAYLRQEDCSFSIYRQLAHSGRLEDESAMGPLLHINPLQDLSLLINLEKLLLCLTKSVSFIDAIF